MEEKIKMMTAVSEALALKKRNPQMDTEKILQYISKFVSDENTKTQIKMIAAASNALSIAEKNANIKEKEIMKRVMKELPVIISKSE